MTLDEVVDTPLEPRNIEDAVELQYRGLLVQRQIRLD
jgi:hypothetical protein